LERIVVPADPVQRLIYATRPRVGFLLLLLRRHFGDLIPFIVCESVCLVPISKLFAGRVP
jgi:hypothetical protein